MNSQNAIWVKLNVSGIYDIGTGPLFMARGITKDWSVVWEVEFDGKEQKGLHPTPCTEFCLLIFIFHCLHGDVWRKKAFIILSSVG